MAIFARTRARLIYLGYGDGALAVIDPHDMKQTGRIELAARPESFQVETEGDQIFVNIPKAHQLVVVVVHHGRAHHPHRPSALV